MKVILKEDIIGLGYKNEVVEVKPGYGRNFLIPQKKAVMATKSALKVLAENLKQQAHKIDVLKAAAQKRANALEGVVVEHRGGSQNHHHARHQTARTVRGPRSFLQGCRGQSACRGRG